RERYSCGDDRGRHQKSTTWVPLTLTMETSSPARSDTAAPCPAGTLILSIFATQILFLFNSLLSLPDKLIQLRKSETGEQSLSAVILYERFADSGFSPDTTHAVCRFSKEERIMTTQMDLKP